MQKEKEIELLEKEVEGHEKVISGMECLIEPTRLKIAECKAKIKELKEEGVVCDYYSEGQFPCDEACKGFKMIEFNVCWRYREQKAIEMLEEFQSGSYEKLRADVIKTLKGDPNE
jgi:hypothetical protein